MNVFSYANLPESQCNINFNFYQYFLNESQNSFNGSVNIINHILSSSKQLHSSFAENWIAEKIRSSQLQMHINFKCDFKRHLATTCWVWVETQETSLDTVEWISFQLNFVSRLTSLCVNSLKDGIDGWMSCRQTVFQCAYYVCKNQALSPPPLRTLWPKIFVLFK